MTLDEAIKICEEDAEKIGGNPQSDRHAERCRQLAEWLTELKDLRILIGGEDNYLTEPTEQADVQTLKCGDYTIDDICAELAQLIGIPCSFRSAEEIMLQKCEDCGDGISDSECWKRYFDTKFSEMLTDTDAGEIANCIEFKKRMKR